MAVTEFIKRVATFAGRSLEFALTGQSDFAVITAELADFKTVTDITKAKRALADIRTFIAHEFRIQVQAPVIIELFSDRDWTPASLRYVMRGAVGSYQPQPLGGSMAHAVHVLSGLSTGRFKAIVAHELVHAYEREIGILSSNRVLREGFARWVEYNVLVAEGERAEAQKLTRVRRWSSGRGILELLDLQRQGGVAAVLSHVHEVP